MSVASSSDSTGNNNEDTHKDKPVGLVFSYSKQTIKRGVFYFLHNSFKLRMEESIRKKTSFLLNVEKTLLYRGINFSGVEVVSGY